MTHSARHVCIVFARFPRPGEVKTRLIPALGAEGAAHEQRLMTEHLLTRLRAWRAQSPQHAIHLYYVGASRCAWRAWLGSDISFFPQHGRTLGARMAHALRQTFRRGAQKAVLIGSDVPGMEPGLWNSAFRALDTHDAVAGPAVDGGYYLIGQRRFIPELFAQVDWGTKRVWEQTQERARGCCTLAVLPTLSDVDTPEDLPVWEGIKRAALPEAWSVIVPVLNEGPALGDVVRQIRTASIQEVIVVDGGSSDDTQAVAEAAGAHVVSSAPGRARQMNVGAQAAQGEALLFLHGDTLLPDGYLITLREVLSRPGVVAGAFSLGIASGKTRYRWVEYWTNWRSRVLGWPYGDQGLFLRRGEWNRVKGFPERPIMEDVGILESLHALGQIVTARGRVQTSPRRWERWGLLKTVWRHQMVWLRYWLREDPERIAAAYRRP